MKNKVLEVLTKNVNDYWSSMSIFGNLFYPPVQEKTVSEKFLENAVNDISSIISDIAPNIKSDMIEMARLNKLLTDPDTKDRINALEQFAINTVNDNLNRTINNGIAGIENFVGIKKKSTNPQIDTDNDTNNDNRNLNQNINSQADADKKIDLIRKEIDNYKKIDSDKLDISFHKTFIMAKKFVYCLRERKTLKIMFLGMTQNGKTATIKYTLNIGGKLELKGNTESDTSKIMKYKLKQNDITLTGVDTPGFGDSKNRSKIFYDMIITYIKNNNGNAVKPIDAFIWFANINDIIDEYTQNIISKLTEDLGIEFWKHTIIVLTHAITVPGSEFYDRAEEILIDDGKEVTEESVKLEAWIQYKNAKIDMWKKNFKSYDINIEIALVENNHYINGKYKTGTGRLPDGAPIIEEFYKSLFTVIEDHKKAPAFVFLAGTVSEPVSANVPKTISVTNTGKPTESVPEISPSTNTGKPTESVPEISTNIGKPTEPVPEISPSANTGKPTESVPINPSTNTGKATEPVSIISPSTNTNNEHHVALSNTIVGLSKKGFWSSCNIF